MKLCECGCGQPAPIAAQTRSDRGFVKGQPQRYIVGHNAPKKHGHAAKYNGGKQLPESPSYRSWKSMVERCSRPGFHAWADYGGRGITVCQRWRSFENFIADMGARPEGKTLDRYPDNDGNYEPGNCRWATPKQQRQNTRDGVVLITFEGVTKSIVDWAAHLNIAHITLFTRYRKGDRPPRLFRPVLLRKHHQLSLTE